VSRAERLILKLWLVASALAAIAMFLNSLVVLLILLTFTIPIALLIECMPTIWLYMTPAIAIYAALRALPGIKRWPGAALAPLAMIPAAVTGFAVPTIANRETDRRAAAVMAEEGGTEPRIPTGASVTYLVDEGLAMKECWDECQRFLFTGTARSYTMGTLDALTSPASSPTPLTRHRMAPITTDCDNKLLKATYASGAEVGDRRPPPSLWDKLPEFEAKGLCFRSDPTRDARSDFVFAEDYHFADPERTRTGFDWRLHPVDRLKRREIFQRQGDRLIRILRRTELHYTRLAVPLAISPPFTFDVHTRGSWRRGSALKRGSEAAVGTQRWVTNDLTVKGP